MQVIAKKAKQKKEFLELPCFCFFARTQTPKFKEEKNERKSKMVQLKKRVWIY